MFKRIMTALGAELPEWLAFFGLGALLVAVVHQISVRLELPLWAEVMVIGWEVAWLLIGIVCVSQVVRAARKGAK